MNSLIFDDLVIGRSYIVTYVKGITNENAAEKVETERFPGVYIGQSAPKAYPEGYRCVCCHRVADTGTFDYLNPLTGGKYHFCQRCISRAVGCERLTQDVRDIYSGYWRYTEPVERANYISELAGTLSDTLKWMELEPELADEIRKRLVDNIRREGEVVKPNY